jgi:hypothetical protein
MIEAKELLNSQKVRTQRAVAVTKLHIELARQLANEAIPGSGDDAESPFLAAVLTALASNYHATIEASK